MACNTQVVLIQDGPSVTPSGEVVLSKESGHQILWISESKQDYEICFANGRSPFEKSVITVPAGRWARSGKIKENADEGWDKKYSYNPRGKTKEVAADPDVIIQN